MLLASNTESSADSDADFDPTAEMLVNDFDDEHTLEEEEAMESVECVANELDDLQREGEMPLNELLAIYGYGSDSAPPAKADSGSTAKSPVKELEPPKVETVASVSKEVMLEPTAPLTVKEDDDEEEEAEIISIRDDPPDVPIGSGPLLRSVSQASESSDSGTDDDYSPDDDWRKTIQVGSDYQAVIPEGLCKYDDAPAYENEDRLLWDPTKLTDEQVEEYLRQSQQPYSTNAQGVNAIPVGSHIRDDEQALFLLLQCGHNMEEALRRRRMQPLHPADTMSLWSEDECRSFETGLKTYGKDFHLIQQNKVRTRSVGELVQFYYLWKKTERHDVFASKNRLEKKKYSLHPGTTDVSAAPNRTKSTMLRQPAPKRDYMDRFLDEQENPTSHRDRSLSPSLHSLIFGDRRRTPASSPPATVTKGEVSPDSASLLPHQHPGAHTFLNALYNPASDKVSHMHSPSKMHNSANECGNKEYLNGENRLSTMDSSMTKDKSSDVPNVHSGSLMSPLYSDKNSHNPPNDVLSCSRHSNETTRLHESHADSCNSRFETCREVASIE